MYKFNNILLILFVIILSVLTGLSIINFIEKRFSNSDLTNIENSKKIDNSKCKCKLSNKEKNINNYTRSKIYIKNPNNVPTDVIDKKEKFNNNITQKFNDKNILTAEEYYENKYYYPFLPLNEYKLENN